MVKRVLVFVVLALGAAACDEQPESVVDEVVFVDEAVFVDEGVVVDEAARWGNCMLMEYMLICSGTGGGESCTPDCHCADDGMEYCLTPTCDLVENGECW